MSRNVRRSTWFRKAVEGVKRSVIKDVKDCPIIGQRLREQTAVAIVADVMGAATGSVAGWAKSVRVKPTARRLLEAITQFVGSD